jgi:hypothetical protein
MKIKSLIHAGSLLLGLCVITALVSLAATTFAAGLPECDSVDMSKDRRIGNIWSKPGFDMKQFSSIVVDRPGVSTMPESTKLNYNEYAEIFQFNLMDKLRNTGYFKSVTGNKSAVNNNTLVLKSELIELNPGSTAARWAVGFGAGRGAVSVKSCLLAGGTEVVMCWHGRNVDISSLNGRALLDRGISVLADRLYLYIERLYNTGR